MSLIAVACWAAAAFLGVLAGFRVVPPALGLAVSALLVAVLLARRFFWPEMVGILFGVAFVALFLGSPVGPDRCRQPTPLTPRVLAASTDVAKWGPICRSLSTGTWLLSGVLLLVAAGATTYKHRAAGDEDQRVVPDTLDLGV